MERYSQPPPASPGKRRSTTPGTSRHPKSAPSPPAQSPNIGPAGTKRGGEEAVLEERTAESEQERWIKVFWKKGECREEIKLVAKASGLSFDKSRIVVLRLYNHFNWLSQLRKRSEQLRAIVGRERRTSLTLVKASADGTINTKDRPTTETISEVQQRRRRIEIEGDSSCGTGEGRDYTNGDFSSYIKGLCILCCYGDFEQTLGLLFMAYSTAREDRMVSRNEIAAILATHVTYDDSKDSNAEKEGTYRWLKRQFVKLEMPSSASSQTGNLGKKKDAVVGEEMANEEPDRSFISWESALDLLKRGPHCLEISLAIHLPYLARDFWDRDLIDMNKTVVTASLQYS